MRRSKRREPQLLSRPHRPSSVNTQPTGRVLGVDLGTKRIGIALSNPDRTVASPLQVIERSGRLHRDLADLVDEWECTAVVVGMPLSLDGSQGPAARKTKKEVAALAATLRVPVETYDERLTTISAERLMTEAGLDSRSQRQVVDKIAASILLQAWLDRQANLHPDHDHTDQSTTEYRNDPANPPSS